MQLSAKVEEEVGTTTVLIDPAVENTIEQPPPSNPETIQTLGTNSLTTKSPSNIPTNRPPLQIPIYTKILFLCWSVSILSSLDRVAMSVALVPMSTTYDILSNDETSRGLISSVFSLGYGLCIIPAGLLVAGKNPKEIMGSGVLIWSLATLGTPLAADFMICGDNNNNGGGGMIAPLLLMRTMVGSAESVVLPSIQRFLSTYIPVSLKSLSTGVIFSGFQMGTIMAYLASPVVIDGFDSVFGMDGWKGMFYFYGVVGLGWLIPWFLFAEDGTPAAVVGDAGVNALDVDVSTIGNAEYNKVTSADNTDQIILKSGDKPEQSKNPPWKEMLKSKAVYAMIIAHAANNWGLYNSLSWTPTFYNEQYGLDIHQSALLSVTPNIAGAICGLFSGFLADKIITQLTKNHSDKNTQEAETSMRTLVRKSFQFIALFGPALCLYIMSNHIPDNPTVARTILTTAVALQAFNAAGYGSSTQEKAGERWSGLLYSVTTLPGVMVGSLGVYVTGVVLDWTGGDWGMVFGLNSLVDWLGALAFVGLYDSKKEFD